MEKDTVFLSLESYDNFKRIERKYCSLKKELNACITKLNKKGNNISDGFMYMDNEIAKVQINLSKLYKVLEIEKYKVEVIENESNI